MDIISAYREAGSYRGAVMGIMGWSTTARYQHVTGIVRRVAARRVGGLIRGDEDAN